MRYLSAHALTTLDRALFELGRNRAIEPDEQDRIVDAVNWASGEMERYTARKLRLRTYRDTNAIACTWTEGSKTIAGTTFTTTLYVGDGVVGTGLAPGSRVDSIAGATSLTLSAPTLSGSSGTLTFGSAPLVVNGDGTSTLWVPEYPLTSLHSVYYLDVDGNGTALDITGARIEKATGKVYLTQDTVPAGTMNIEVNCTAGYEAPTATTSGSAEWYDLEHWCLRLATVQFQDSIQKRGRIVSETLLQSSSTLPDFKMPADIAGGLAPYRRLW
jgi:hypothetical protein